jgi:hypothetical protein
MQRFDSNLYTDVLFVVLYGNLNISDLNRLCMLVHNCLVLILNVNVDVMLECLMETWGHR